VERQIEAQRRTTARTLGIDPRFVFAMSARDALTARISGDARGLHGSRLPAFEEALGSQMLRRRHELLHGIVDDAARQLQSRAGHLLGERRRQVAEQTLELRGLRGKSGARLRAAQKRIATETAEFEQCIVQMKAVRAVHSRMFRQTLQGLSSDRLRDELAQMQQSIGASLLKLNAKKIFAETCARLRAMLGAAQAKGEETHAMHGASYARLNAEFGLGLALSPPPPLQRFVDELDLIESRYLRYLGLTHGLRLAQTRFMEQFRRMLLSKLRVVFESASTEIELWNKTASAQANTQLGERRRAFRQRAEALERIQQASGELEQRIEELEAQEARLQLLLLRLGKFAAALRQVEPPEVAPQGALPQQPPRERARA
jgi:hypothetical protein